MPIYFLVLDADLFQRLISPVLAASWRQRSFAPCHELCGLLLPSALDWHERYPSGDREPLPARVVAGLPFDRDLWRLLVGEVLLYAAIEVPELPTAPHALAELLGATGPWDELPRQGWPPIRQVHFGSRELVFGGFYRPDHAGFNDPGDVRRLADYLDRIDPSCWDATTLAALAGPEPEDQEDELALARDSLAGLRGLYRRAADQGRIIVCESL